MPDKELRVGNIVESKCIKCKDVTRHTIWSIVQGEIAKVECRVCGSLHKYRPVENPHNSPKSGRKKKKKQEEPPQTDQEWLRQMEGKNGTQALTYSMQNSYSVQDLIDHPKFGVGVVQRLIDPNKMDVIFQDGLKRLRCDFSSRN